MDLQEIRGRIDDIDAQLVALFAERMHTIRDVARYKAEHHLQILDSGRERKVLLRAAERGGPDLERYTRRLFTTLMDVSRSYQRGILDIPSPLVDRIREAMASTPAQFPTRATVACQGTEGAFSQQACDALFPLANILYFDRFESVFEAVEQGLCRYGVLPIENSLAGSVTQVYDLMHKYHFSVVRGMRQRIDHALLAKPGVGLSEIRQVYTHPQALSQCSAFLRAHPAMEAIPCENTAVAAKKVASSEDRTMAAIASRVCADLYGLSVVNGAVANDENNHTRFLCIGKALEIYPDADKIGLSVTLPHKPGSLYGLMSKFAAMDLNLTKLESRPIPGRDFEFCFHIDLEATVANPEVVSLLAEIEQTAERFQFLGCWREV